MCVFGRLINYTQEDDSLLTMPEKSKHRINKTVTLKNIVQACPARGRLSNLSLDAH